MPLPLYNTPIVPPAAERSSKPGVPSGPPVPTGSAVPGTQAIHIRTYGCSHNISDSEYLAGQLAAYGYRIADDEAVADLCIINSCTVKGPSQESFFSGVRRLKQQGKRIVVAGCVPQADRDNPQLAGISMLGVQQIDRVVEVVEETLRGHTVRLLDKAHRPGLDLPKIRKNRFIEIIPISVGCLGACTYCKTKHARGHLGSYSPDAIKARMLSAIAEGVTQVWLTSEDCGAYGRDIGTSLSSLLRELVPLLPEHAMLRIGMANPPFILGQIEELAPILSHPRVFSFIHLPAQSGSDSVLRAMRRDYDAAQFQHVVDGLLSRVPGLTVATDIICGFPTETQADFAQTIALVERNTFPILNISQFYPRPDTPAARMKLLPTQEVKRRSTELTRLFKAQRPYDSLVGTRQQVWIGDTADGQLVAHTKSYVLALLPLDEKLLGRSAIIEVTFAGKHFIRGEIVRVLPPAHGVA